MGEAKEAKAKKKEEKKAKKIEKEAEKKMEKIEKALAKAKKAAQDAEREADSIRRRPLSVAVQNSSAYQKDSGKKDIGFNIKPGLDDQQRVKTVATVLTGVNMNDRIVQYTGVGAM